MVAHSEGKKFYVYEQVKHEFTATGLQQVKSQNTEGTTLSAVHCNGLETCRGYARAQMTTACKQLKTH